MAKVSELDVVVGPTGTWLKKAAGLERSTQEPVRKNFPIIPSSLIQRRWIPRFMKSSTNT